MTRFWWVSQNETFEEEATGGFMWSPKTNKNGNANRSYDNMTLIARGDIIFSYAGTIIRAIGIATTSAYESTKPQSFGSKGSNWLDAGWRVDVDYSRLETSVKPKDFMEQIGPLLPDFHSPLRPNGVGNQAYLFEISSAMATLLMDLVHAPELKLEVATLSDLSFDEEEQLVIADTTLEETVKATLVQSRRGQGLFRKRVHLIEVGCRVTQVTAEKLLVASHIKPWRTSTNEERMSGNNGLFLSPHVDALFDKGYITFAPSGKIEVSPMLDTDVLARWKIDPKQNVGKFNSEQKYFLEYHEKEVFKVA
jgi:putative restriction endonuclease